ncbi:MAG: antibiotic biosynthesis monooxygenase [Bacteroidales bacterium]|nr:antibiotic biosynthesis monooxygenase [Bacteroidales bacterium]
MIISFTKIDLLPGKQQVVVDILRSVIGPTRLRSGCMDCSVYTDQGEGQTILYFEQWQSREFLDRHIRSELYFRVLSAMELAREPPEMYFHEVSETRGLEYVEALR